MARLRVGRCCDSFGEWALESGSSTPVTMISAFGNIDAKVEMNGIEPPTPMFTDFSGQAALKASWAKVDPQPPFAK